MKQRATNITAETELPTRINKFGEHVKNIISKRNIKYLMPLETKGALLVDMACGKGILPESLNIIYPRALRYIPSTVIASSGFLLVDDIFFSGRHLKRVFEQVRSYGAKDENIHCLAFLDFSCGDKDKDYEGSMHDRICENLLPGSFLKRRNTLIFLQKEMLEKTMPSVYDHLTIEADGVDNDKYSELLRKLSLDKRLLHYGQRGAYQASSILLDDLFDGEWDVPPKARLWWHSTNKKLRITPVGFVSNNNNGNDKKLFDHDLHKAIVDTVVSKSDNDIEEAEYESVALEGRLQQLMYLKKYLYDLGLKFTFDNDHLDRYYPGLKIAEKIQSVMRQCEMIDLPARAETNEDIGYYSAIVEVLKLNRKAWETQPIDLPKDRIKKGYTAAEIFRSLRNFSDIEIHAAIDYCFDFHYLAVFRRKDETGFARCYRTTEIFDDFFPEEIFGAAIIYSLNRSTPDWLINKVFPIIRNVIPGSINDGYLAITKAYFGDITRIKQSENSYCSWKDVQTELWDIEPSGAGVCYKKKEDPLIEEKVKDILDDARLVGFRDTLAAVIFLLENGGRDSGILLNILTSGYGGADYIAYNLARLLSYGSKYPTGAISNSIEWHSKGADEKIDIILRLFDNHDNLLKKLKRLSSRLQLSYLFQLQAEKVINKARPFTSRIIYDSLKKLKNGISDAVIASRENDAVGFEAALNSINIKSIKRTKNNDLRYLLSKAAYKIYPILYAISGQTFSWSYYLKYIINSQHDFSFILGYDLTGERRKVVPDGEELTRFDDEAHKFIANWIIAFNGKLSTSGMNAGDLRFGFFKNLDEAIGAGCWLLHHIDQLKETRCFPIGKESIGIVISSGNYKIDSTGNASGKILDMSGHWLKGKIVERDRIDAATAKVGRKAFEFQDSQAWILEHGSFEVDRSNRKMIGAPKKLSYKNGFINLSAINIDTFLNNSPTPWINRT